MTAAFTKQKFKIPTIFHKIDQTGNCWFIPTTVLQNARFFRNEFEEFSRNEDCVNAGHRVYCLVVSHPDTSAQPERPVAMLTSAGISGKLFGVRDTSHTKLNNDLGLPDDANHWLRGELRKP